MCARAIPALATRHRDDPRAGVTSVVSLSDNVAPARGIAASVVVGSLLIGLAVFGQKLVLSLSTG